VNGRLHVSNRAHLIFAHNHRELDKAAEGASRREQNWHEPPAGSVRPYEDKMARRGRAHRATCWSRVVSERKAAHVVADEEPGWAKGA